MKRNISVALLALALLTGCGGSKTDDNDGISNKTIDDPMLPTSITNAGKTDGTYNLWNYMTPKTSTTNSFIETKGDKTNEYTTTYSISEKKVTETSDYAQDEKTVYKKKEDRVTVEFLKNDKFNGSYDLHLTADIDGDVTILTSTCKLTEHFDKKTISNKDFLDVIEIKCNDKPGYYEKGTGEIAQTEVVDAKGVSSLRVLTN
jgi:major membrane immunogen (membrane-anchored lipoprotein)